MSPHCFICCVEGSLEGSCVALCLQPPLLQETGVFLGFSADINHPSPPPALTLLGSQMWERWCRGLAAEKELTAAACGG